LYFTHYQLPISNTTRLQFEEEYLKKQFRINDKNLHRQYAPNTIAYFESFSTINNVGYRFSIEKWSEDGTLSSKLLADRARYDSVSGKWEIENYYIRTFGDSAEVIDQGR